MKLVLTILVTVIFFSVTAQPENAMRRRNFNHENGVAMKYFDPVSYFAGKPVKGDIKRSFVHKGIEYFFSSEENLEAFKKNPDKFEPAYGGWCAFNMAMSGTQTKINPATYKIINGKLYLFSNFNGKNMLVKWNHDEKKLKQDGDRNWTKKMKPTG